MNEDTNNQKSPVALREESILEFWNANGIFKKSLEKPAPKGDFVFYDGPPFATGSPHFGHVLPTSIKDAIPRYKTMQGFRVRRRWGWDCHGLPIENLIEKELGLATKKDILDYGIGKFNAKAKESVLRYADEWRKIIPRLGRWVDMDEDYRTMDASYTESVWWAFKKLYDKNLVYEGFKAMQLCPRCETTLSNFEVNQGYKDITDISVFVKFKLVDSAASATPLYFLAWTTTPWTLPGNVALAVHPEITYVTIEIPAEEGKQKEQIILAEERLSIIKKQYTVMSKVKGTELVGKSYVPVFDYYSKNTSLKNHKNGWKVYAADFVTTTDGSGIVHIAPAFGSDDMELGKKYDLPFVQHVGTDGRFKKEVTHFAGQLVKPKSSEAEKDAHQKGDIEVIKYLAGQTPPTLFAKEKIIHSYPHCWRCDTPLLNYASSSWFVKVPDIKEKLVAENKKVNWVPNEVGEGRFGNWLSGARDWAISRSRFWGAPLPVWRTEPDAHGHSESIFIGSVDDLKKYSHANNTYFVMRHGEAENNTKGVISSTPTIPHHLTEKGRAQVKEAAKWLLDKKIDVIYASPFIRTRETAELVSEHISFPKEKIIFDETIGELKAGAYDGIPFNEFIEKFGFEKRFITRPPDGKIKGENYVDVKKRMGDFLYGLEKKYSGADAGKRILIVTHDSPMFLLVSAIRGLTEKESVSLRGTTDHFSDNAKPIALDFKPLPHNDAYELDLHRPFIDTFELTAPSGKKLSRIPEVFDCWFESGSMPFGEAHYPFTSDEFEPNPGLFAKIFKKTKGYPADFIAEGLDQTRGWFYSMLVLGVALFGRSPYKNVIVNGLVLAEDGQKMSKSKKNFPDLMPVVEKYGADALRYYLLSSPLVRAQEFCFSERGVDEVVKKHIGRLNNVVTFYEMYAEKGGADTFDVAALPETKNILDLWILARLAELTRDVTVAMDTYELDRATRPFADFIDDVSTWYLRRSRDRFKSDDAADKKAALATTRYVLIKTATLLAPFMPFVAEDIFQKITGNKAGGSSGSHSVHLLAWPDAGAVDSVILKKMSETRRVTSLALEARMKAKINVRQPLATLSLKAITEADIFGDLVKDEVNVKNIIANNLISNEVELDTTISAELKEEGNVREFIRAIQDLRKKENFTVSDVLTLSVSTDAAGTAFLKKNSVAVSKVTGLKKIEFVEGGAGQEVLVDAFRFIVSVSK